jgi:hypothetical protein
MVVARRQTLVQLTDDLVILLDAIAAKQGTTRSALIRSVLEGFVKDEDEAEKDRRLIEGYTKFPPGGVDEYGDIDAWMDAALEEAAKDWPPWEPNDDAG